jgi:hypothetical protein
VNARITPALVARLHAELDARFTTTTKEATVPTTSKVRITRNQLGVPGYNVYQDGKLLGRVERQARGILTMDARYVERDVRWQGFTPDGRRTLRCSKRSRVVEDLVAGYFVKEA